MTKAAAIRRIAEGLYELADALFAESAVAEASAGVLEPLGANEELDSLRVPGGFVAEDMGTAWSRGPNETVIPEPQGSAAVCPKHRIPYTEGQYGPYCKSTTDDPAWGKAKGDKLWCRITPKNAAEWLRITAAA